MKSLITIIAIMASANSFAYSIADSTVLTIASPFLTSATTSGGLQKAEAEKVMRDSQEFLQTGEASISLSAKIAMIQESDASVSAQEAVGLLMEDAQSVLGK